MRKSKIINVSDLQEYSIDLNNILEKESEIAGVLISTSYLNELLRSLLKNKFIQKSDTVKKILSDDEGILGSFIARAEMAYCIKAIDKETFQDLKNISEIRNLFAHSYFKLSFNDKIITGLCEKLRSYLHTYPDVLKNKNGELGVLVKINGREKFNRSVLRITHLLSLEGFADEMKLIQGTKK